VLPFEVPYCVIIINIQMRMLALLGFVLLMSAKADICTVKEDTK